MDVRDAGVPIITPDMFLDPEEAKRHGEYLAERYGGQTRNNVVYV